MVARLVRCLLPLGAFVFFPRLFMAFHLQLVRRSRFHPTSDDFVSPTCPVHLSVLFA